MQAGARLGLGGVVLSMEPSAAALADARDYDDEDTYLLQNSSSRLTWKGGSLVPRQLLRQSDDLLLAPETRESWSPRADCALRSARAGTHLAHDRAGFRLPWFSPKSLTWRSGRFAFLPIDYLNNKCFMLTHAEFGASGMPMPVAETVTREIAEQTLRRTRAPRPARSAPAPIFV